MKILDFDWAAEIISAHSTMSQLAGATEGGSPAHAADVLRDERGAEQMEYVLIVAAVIVPLVIATRLFWAVLLFYFAVETLVIDLPLF